MSEDESMAAFNASLRAKLLSARLSVLSKDEIVAELNTIAEDCLLAIKYQDKLTRRLLHRRGSRPSTFRPR